MDLPGDGVGSRRAPPPPPQPQPVHKAPRALVVDGDAAYLKVLERLLRQCCFEVATCSQTATAMKMLRERKGDFDVVLTDAFMPDMAGFRLMDRVHVEMDLPVVMMSNGGGKGAMARAGATEKEAFDYIAKPVSTEALHKIRRRILQRRRRQQEEPPAETSPDVGGSSAASPGGSGGKRKREEKNEEQEPPSSSAAAPAAAAAAAPTLKKQRVVWTAELHGQFVDAVKKLGQENAVPKRILELMNVPGLTRENVASHLQKYRLSLRRGELREQRKIQQESPAFYPKLVLPHPHLMHNAPVPPRSDLYCNAAADDSTLYARSARMQHQDHQAAVIRALVPQLYANQLLVARAHSSNVYMANNNVDLLRNSGVSSQAAANGGPVSQYFAPPCARDETYGAEMHGLPRPDPEQHQSNGHVGAAELVNVSHDAYYAPTVHVRDEVTKSCTMRQEVYSVRTQVQQEYVVDPPSSFNSSDGNNVVDTSYEALMYHLPPLDPKCGNTFPEFVFDELRNPPPDILDDVPPFL